MQDKCMKNNIEKCIYYEQPIYSQKGGSDYLYTDLESLLKLPLGRDC